MNAILIQLVLLFGYIILGFTCNKIGVFDSVSDKIFSNLLLKITLPASIIASAIGQSTENRLVAIYVLIIAIVLFLIKPLWAMIFQKVFRCDDAYKLMLTYPNLGFMGFPIVTALYGDLGLFLASLFMIIFNLSVFSYGVSVIQKNSKFQVKNLLSPGIISALLALIIFFFSIPMPSVLTNFLSTIGNITSPLAMITLGSTLGAINIKSIFQDKLLYFFTFCKLVLWPFMIWLPLHYIINDPMIIGITVILTSLPVAGNVSMLCISYGGNTELVAKGTCISTLVSFLSIPVYMMIFAIS